MPPQSKVELYAAIRRDARTGMSGRAPEHKYNVGRRTVVNVDAVVTVQCGERHRQEEQ